MARRQVSIFINGRAVENTLKGIYQEKRKINAELRNMEIGSDAYIKKTKELKDVNRQLDDHHQQIRGTESAYKKITKGAAQFLSIAGIAFTAETIISYGAELFRLGTEMEVLGEKAKIVFAQALPAVTREAERNATAMGLTTGQYIDASAAIGDLLVPMGFQREEAADISTELVNLSGALAEWTGGQRTAEEVTQVLGKAILGEREQLKELGIGIKESDVQARLAEKGLEGLTGTMLQQAKAAATLELITEKSADAQAAFAANSDTLVRKQAELQAKIQQVTERLASALIPAFSRLLDIAVALSDSFSGIGVSADSLTAEFDQQSKKVNSLESELVPLLQRYEDLQSKSELSKDEQNELATVIQRIGDLTPTAITQVDNYGKALAINADASRDFLKTEKARLRYVNAKTIPALEEQIEKLTTLRDVNKRLVETGETGGILGSFTLRPEEIRDAQKKLQAYTLQLEGAQAQLARLTGEDINIPAPGNNSSGDDPKQTSPTDEELEAQKERAQKLAEQRRNQGEKQAEQQQQQLTKLRQIIEGFQQEAFMAALGEDERQLERIRLRYQEQIELVKELETQGVQGATELRLQLEALQSEALREARNQRGEEDLEAAIAAADAENEALLAQEQEYTDKKLAELEERALKEEKLREEERKKKEREAREEIKAQIDQANEIATVAASASSIVGSVIDLLGDKAAENTALGKTLALVQIAINTAEGISKAVAAGAGIPFPGNLPAIASGIAAVTSGIVAARAAFAEAPAVPQRKEGGYVVQGAQDGMMYNASYLGRRKTGMLPGGAALVDTVGGPVLANERGSEYFVNAQALQNPVVMDHVRAIDNIARMRQFAAGGFTSDPPPTATDTPTVGGQQASMDAKMLAEAVSKLNMMLERGILAVIDDDTIIDVRDRTRQLVDASGGVL